MILPDRPRVGLVLRYSYLWADDHEKGLREGLKDRPCAIVLAVRQANESDIVYVVPVTHAPNTASGAVEMPLLVARHLGLDEGPSWIVTTELNVFLWPGPDLRPIRRDPSSRHDDVPCFYKVLPAEILEQVKRSLRANFRLGNVRAVKR
jgi:hypothetical protein